MTNRKQLLVAQYIVFRPWFFLLNFCLFFNPNFVVFFNCTWKFVILLNEKYSLRWCLFRQSVTFMASAPSFSPNAYNVFCNGQDFLNVALVTSEHTPVALPAMELLPHIREILSTYQCMFGLLHSPLTFGLIYNTEIQKYKNQCARKSPQFRTWSSWGPNCRNGPHNPHAWSLSLQDLWYIYLKSALSKADLTLHFCDCLLQCSQVARLKPVFSVAE